MTNCDVFVVDDDDDDEDDDDEDDDDDDDDPGWLQLTSTFRVETTTWEARYSPHGAVQYILWLYQFIDVDLRCSRLVQTIINQFDWQQPVQSQISFRVLLGVWVVYCIWIYIYIYIFILI